MSTTQGKSGIRRGRTIRLMGVIVKDITAKPNIEKTEIAGNSQIYG